MIVVEIDLTIGVYAGAHNCKEVDEEHRLLEDDFGRMEDVQKDDADVAHVEVFVELMVIKMRVLLITKRVLILLTLSLMPKEFK